MARNQDNVSEWSDMSTRGLLFQYPSTKNPIKRVGVNTKWTSSSSSSNVTCSRHDIAEICSFGVKHQSLTHFTQNQMVDSLAVQ